MKTKTCWEELRTMNLLKVELTKLTKKTNTKVFLIIYGVIFLAIALIYVMAENMLDLSFYSGTQFVGASLNTMMAFMLPLLTIFFAGSSESLDFTRGTMKNMYLLPISRSKLFISKLGAVQVIVGSVLGIQFVFSILISFIVDGFTFVGVAPLFLDYLGAFLVLGLVNILGNVLSLIFKNTGLTVIIAYIGYVGLRLLTMYIPSLDAISLATVIDNYKNILDVSTINMLLSTVAYYIILFIVGLLLFEKKEESLCQFE